MNKKERLIILVFLSFFIVYFLYSGIIASLNSAGTIINSSNILFILFILALVIAWSFLVRKIWPKINYYFINALILSLITIIIGFSIFF